MTHLHRTYLKSRSDKGNQKKRKLVARTLYLLQVIKIIRKESLLINYHLTTKVAILLALSKLNQSNCGWFAGGLSHGRKLGIVNYFLLSLQNSGV